MKTGKFLISLLSLLLLGKVNASADLYHAWATSHWGAGTTSNIAAKITTWGENADPDNDGLPNLLEYTADSSPTQANPATDCYEFKVLTSGTNSSRYPQLFAWQRIDDPDLRVMCQVSSNLFSWRPSPSLNLESASPPNLYVHAHETGNLARNLRQIGYTDLQSMASRPAAFMRLHVTRRGSSVTTTGIDPFSFTSQTSLLPNSVGRSNAIVLSGFVGSISSNIPSGVTLYLNGTAQTGSTTTINAGDTIWLEVVTSTSTGTQRSFTLNIGGQSAQWIITSAAAASVNDHAGVESGYTPVEVGVSASGSSQVSIPIVSSSGTSGMQENVSINYSNQGSNGPLGVGFSVSGYSSITRIGRTVAHDGIKSGVSYNVDDRYALDGQRLIAINGADGGDGTEYRLEFDPITRIRSYSSSGMAPDRWVVETSSGLTRIYGGSPSSRQSAPLNYTGFAINNRYDLFNDNGTGIDVLLRNEAPIRATLPVNSLKTAFVNGPTRHYGQGMFGYIIPKITGAYRFQLRTSYQGYFAINPDGDQESGLVQMGRGGTFSTAEVNLEANKRYIFKALHYQYKTSSNQFEVYWRGPDIPEGAGGTFTTLVQGEYLEAARPENAQPRTSAWGLDSVQDTSGNRILYDYDTDALAEGTMLLSKIRYTENVSAGLTPQSEIRFVYENREDSREIFLPNDRRESQKTSKRLASVESRSNTGAQSIVLRTYNFNWRYSLLTGRSLLGSIQEAAANISRTTTFSWLDQALGALSYGTTDSPVRTAQWDKSNVQSGDFDGDGRADLLSIGTDGGLTVIRRFSTGLLRSFLEVGAPGRYDSVAYETVRTIPDRGFNKAAMWLLDANSDGMVDIVTRLTISNSKIVTYLANGSGGFTSVESDPGFAWNTGTVATGDMNGDGRTDFVAGLQTATIRSFISNGNGTFSTTDTTQSMTGTGPILYQGDFNADGRMDFVSNIVSNNFGGEYFYWDIQISNGDGTFTAKRLPYNGVYGVLVGQPIIGDFNGDSISDIAKLDGTTLTVFLLDGEVVRKVVQTNTGITGLVLRPDWVGNVNGDDSPDLFGWGGGVNTLVRLISDGKGGFSVVSQPNLAASTSSQAGTWIADFDGDGKSELITDNTSLTYFKAGSTAIVEDAISTVTNHHGGRTTFNYGYLTDPLIYTKGSGLTYPNLDIQAPILAVKSLTSRNGIDGDPFTAGEVSAIGLNTVNYRYEGAWSNLDGRGFQGFKAVETTDATSGITSRTEYESSSPLLAGRVKRSEQRLINPPPGGSSLISESASIWNLRETTHPTGKKTYFVSEATSLDRSYEVNRPATSSLLRIVTRDGNSFDSYGNLLTSNTTTTGTETFTESITNTYSDAPTPTKWHLGRLATSAVTKTGPNPSGSGSTSLTRRSSFQYHPTTGLLTQEVIEPSGGVLRQQKDYTHDGYGNILTSTVSCSGAPSRTTTTTYTPDGRFVASTSNALGHTESKTYDPLTGNVLTQTGPNGLTTSWQYDAIGRPLQENRPDGTVTRSFYRRVTGSTTGAPPRAVHYVRVESTGSAPKTVWYDLLDREIRMDGIAFDGRTVSSHKVYNNRGEITHASQPYFEGATPLYSTLLYDAVGRGTQQTDPGNRITKTTHNGFTTTVERNYNPASPGAFQKAVTVVNTMGWTIQASQYLDASAKTITRKYDPYGNLRFVIDPAGNTTELRYDLRGNKVWMSEPNSGVSSFTYNGFSELVSQVNAANQSVTLTYDKLGRILSRTEPEGVSTFEYDSASKGIGQLARETSPGFSRVYHYDSLSRPVATIETHGFHKFAASRSYDAAGRPATMTYPTGLATSQVYTFTGHLSEVRNAASSVTYWKANAVNERGQITQETLGNGVVTNRSFDPESGLIAGITSSKGATGNIQKLGFDFDLIGNLTDRRDTRLFTPFEESFAYDTLNRLRIVDTPGATSVVANYNDIGNLISRSDVGTFRYARIGNAGPHALTSVVGTSSAFTKTCTTDAKGNRTGDGTTSIDYSSYNKPVRMSKGGDTLRFDYGPERSIFRQTTFLVQPSGATSQTVREYIGGIYERETNSEGLVRHIHYIAGGSGVVAIQTDERSASNTAQRTRYVHKDHLGSVDVITDNAGALVERHSFDAWGRRRTVAFTAGDWEVSYTSTPAGQETHRGFTGHEMLDAVGLVHMGGRIYDPITSRFLSPDPFVQSPDNLQNLNRYSYVLNNPLSFTDPSGFFFKSIAKFIGKHWKTIVAVGVGFATGGAFAALAPAWGAAAAGAGFGFGSAFSGTLLAGGSVGDALRAGLKGGVVGGVSAGASKWVGGAYQNYPGMKVFVHGAVQGGIRSASGGNFVHGALSSAFASQFSGVADKAGGVWEGRAVAAVVGGTAEAIGGGKFGNGAVTGAFIRMFNDEEHPAESSNAKKGRLEDLSGTAGNTSDVLENRFKLISKYASNDALKLFSDIQVEAFGKIGSFFGALSYTIDVDQAIANPTFKNGGEAFISGASMFPVYGWGLGLAYEGAMISVPSIHNLGAGIFGDDIWFGAWPILGGKVGYNP